MEELLFLREAQTKMRKARQIMVPTIETSVNGEGITGNTLLLSRWVFQD